MEIEEAIIIAITRESLRDKSMIGMSESSSATEPELVELHIGAPESTTPVLASGTTPWDLGIGAPTTYLIS